MKLLLLECMLLYICETGDCKQQMRSRQFRNTHFT